MRPEQMQPCAQDGFATLSVCKSVIRRQATCGDVVVAYRVNPRSRNKLSLDPSISFIGIVDTVIPMREYMGNNEMITRKDNLYSSTGVRSTPTTDFNRKHWTYGGLSEEKVIERDWGGRNVLVFKEFIDASRGVGHIDDFERFSRISRRFISEPHFKAGDKSRRGHRKSAI